MSADPELTEQMAFVHTPDARDVLETMRARTGLSRAAVIRYCFNKVFGLKGLGYLPPGKTADEVVALHVAHLGEKRERHTRNEV